MCDELSKVALNFLASVLARRGELFATIEELNAYNLCKKSLRQQQRAKGSVVMKVCK
jgi:hypothetical protein